MWRGMSEPEPSDAEAAQAAAAAGGQQRQQRSAARRPLRSASRFETDSRVLTRFRVKKWNAVAVWSWNVLTDTCAICRNNLHEPSIEYQAQVRCQLRR